MPDQVHPETNLPAVDTLVRIPVGLIDPDPDQPRFEWDTPDAKADLEQLGESLVSEGQLEPITVLPHPELEGRYLLEDGERRWRAAKLKGIAELHALFVMPDRALDETERLLAQIAHNSGRPLTALEEAKAFARLVEQGLSQAEIARRTGRPRATVGDRLAMVEAPEAFMPLFASGELSAAAAPIVRQFAELPPAVAKKLVEEARDSWTYERDRNPGKPVPLATVKLAFEDTLRFDFCPLPTEHAAEYSGPTFTVKGQTYAVDRDKGWAFRHSLESAARAKTRESGEPTKWEEEERKRRKAEAAKLKKRNAERAAQFAAVVAQLPATLDEAWLRFAVRWLLHEMHNDSRRLACKALGLEAAKSKYGGWEYGKTLRAHADTLDTGGLAQLLLQLLLTPDSQVQQWSTGGPERLKDAAQLLGLDLSKVKPGDEAPANPIAAKPRPPASEVLSAFVIGTLDKKLAKRPIDQWSNEVLLAQRDGCVEQLEKFDDPEKWPLLHPGSREQCFLAGERRDRVVADLAELTRAAALRGLMDEPAPPKVSDDQVQELRAAIERGEAASEGEALACIYCGCTEDNACEGGCSWYSTVPPVCTAEACLAAHEAHDEEARARQREEADDDLWDADEEDGYATGDEDHEDVIEEEPADA